MKGSGLGDRLRVLISEKGVTPYEISKKTGISQSTLSRILNNTTTKLNINNLTLLSKYFNVEYDWLSTGKGPKMRGSYPDSSFNRATASDYVASYRNDDALVDSQNRMARALETLAESNKELVENNKRVTETNEKVMSEMLGLVKDLKEKK